MPGARCAICGTRVGPDDAPGVLDGAPAHAECALVHWLWGVKAKPAIEPRMSRRGRGSETMALIEELKSLCGSEHELDR